MEVYRPSTRDSLQTFLPSQPQRGVSHDRRSSQATSTAQSQTTLQYSDEKSVVEPPFPEPRSKVALAVNSYPLEPVYHHQPYQQAYWCSDGDIDPVPRYPGTPHLPDVSATLAVPPIERADRFEGTICGVKRGLFILLLTIAGIVLMAIAIGVGLGVGLGHQRQIEAQAGSSSSSSSTSSVPIAATTATPTIPTTFESSSFPSSASSSASGTKTLSAAVPVATGSCPSIQNTQYITSNGKRFFQMCGYDYAGKGEANEIGSARTKTFTQCMEICAKKLDCMGAGWGVSDDNPDQHICRMKNNLRKSHETTSTWSFAILIVDTVGNEDEV